MKSLIFASLLLGSLSQAAGCIITSDDDDDGNGGNGNGGGDEFAALDVAWDLEGGCPAGATTIQIVADNGANAACTYDEDDDLDGTWCELVDCTATGSLTTIPSVRDVYDVYINVTDESTDARYASSLAVEVDTTVDADVIEVPTFVFPTDAGYMELTWNILDAATDEEIECADVGAVDVGFLASVIPADDTVDPYDFTWACEEFAGITGPMLLGDYTIAIDVLDADGGKLNDESAIREESLTYGNERVDLGNFDFAFTL